MKMETELSLDRSLIEKVDTLARELNTTRSQLVETAVQEFIERIETRRMMAALNEVYRDGPDEEEQAILRAIRAYHRKLMKDEQW